MVIERWSDFDDPGARVVDNYWNESGVWYTYENNVNTQSPGTYYALYCPFDSSGNAGECIMRYIVVEEPTSINNSMSFDIEVYPNPAQDFVTIKAPTNSVLSVFDSKGKLLVNSTSKDQYQILNASAWSAGVYLLQVQSKEQLISTRIQIAR